MHLRFRNVNDAFMTMVNIVHYNQVRIQRTTSRYGDCITIMEPMLFTYSHPRERVLLHRNRDVNPFFHFYESMWMLAGRNDVAPLEYYVKRMKEFSDDGETLNGAYGYRWRTYWRNRDNIDQIKLIIDHLKALPNSRRAVLNMWNVEDDLLKVGPDNYSKDVCCNLNVMFSLREVPEHYGNAERQGNLGPDVPRALDMTVTNRSNDMIWGMLGANFVHFTFLQEYIARHLGVEVGVYNHFTNNLHCYENNWKPEEWLDGGVFGTKLFDAPHPMTDIDEFEKELDRFVDINSVNNEGNPAIGVLVVYKSDFLQRVGQPLLDVFHMFKQKFPIRQCMKACYHIKDEWWRSAALIWLDTRSQKIGVEKYD